MNALTQNLTIASRQWSSRPADERFTSLVELDDFCQSIKTRSRQRDIQVGDLQVLPHETDHKALSVCTAKGSATFTHWSFGQAASLAGAPASYLRDLPAPLAADCLQYGLISKRADDVRVLATQDETSGAVSVRAFNSTSYGRVWNSDVTAALLSRFGDGVSGHWRVPGIFGHKLDEVTKENTTLYASDRDMFVFLADEDRRIELPNRRDGQPGSLARGFIIGNSEVGAGTLFLMAFLFDYVCSNRIIWGARDVQNIRIRHTSGAPDRFISEVRPAVEAYAAASAAPLLEQITAARKADLDEEAVTKWLRDRLTRTQTEAVKAVHLVEEGRPIESRWDIATAVSAYARGVEYADERVKLERVAGDIF